MPRFAANLSFLYQEYPFLDRFRAAAEDGFRGVEYLFPYEYPPDVLVDSLRENGLEQVLFNAPPGDWNAGERGLAALPGREEEFQISVQKAIRYAEALGNDMIHVMAGCVVQEASREVMRQTYLENLTFAAEEAARAGKSILIEPINTRDMPGYFLNRQDQAHEVREAVGRANLKVQFDLYHAQVVEGDLETKLRRWAGEYAHVQAAGVPLRHEPDTGEVNYVHLFNALDELKYPGWVGCEYRPRSTTREGLGWIRRWKQTPQPVE